MQTSFYSRQALGEIDVEHQLESLGGLLIENDPLRGRSIPEVPDFEQQSPSEVLLLTCTMPGTDTVSPTERTLQWIWDSLPSSYTVQLNVGTVSDVTGNDTAHQFRWVAFDPLGITVDEESDFRADILIGRFAGRMPGLDLAGGKRDPNELAGIEAFMGMLLLPQLTNEVWDGYTVVTPRLEASDSLDFETKGVLNFYSRREYLRVQRNPWRYNFYGHRLAIPTIRELT